MGVVLPKPRPNNSRETLKQRVDDEAPRAIAIGCEFNHPGIVCRREYHNLGASAFPLDSRPNGGYSAHPPETWGAFTAPGQSRGQYIVGKPTES